MRSYLHMTSTGARIGGKRIVPSFGKDKRKSHTNGLKKVGSMASLSSSQSQRHRIKQRTESNEPLVHYNGPLETLDQLPKEKLAWITKESNDSSELRQPLLDYPRSIVFRKPHNRNLPTLGYYDSNNRSDAMRPKATFYIRVLQVIQQNSSKPCLLRSSIELNNQVFSGSYATSQKCGKHGSQANVDETYILDVDRPTTTKLSIYSQPKTAFGAFNSRFRQPEVCLGTQEFQIPMRPSEKQLKRITLRDNETNDQYQVLVVYGTYVSSRVMTLLDNKRIYEGFITVYTRGKLIPRWARYWAALYPGHLELYDFEYKETRKALYKISIKALLDVFHPPTDDDERLVDVGSLGLALQFSHESLDINETHPDFEYRMYILPDDLERSQEWEQSFMHAASLINEFRYDENYIATKIQANPVIDTDFHLNDVEEDQDEVGTMIISSKFLW
ncbi:unnamed protein product [Mucor hiemalis]